MTELSDLASRLAGAPVTAMVAARPGGNNRIFRVETAEGGCFALKIYPSQDADPRDRLGAEWAALSFLAGNGIEGIPVPLARDRAAHAALYTWLAGEPVARGEGTEADVAALAAFLARLQDLRDRPGAAEIAPASAACLAPWDAVSQFQARLGRLREACPDQPALAALVEGELVPLAGRMIARLEQAGMAAAPPLAPGQLFLSPSDFGLHNALRAADGGLAFLDFEYFGWDDPAKAVADAALHPGSALSPELRRAFLAAILPLASADPDFARRFQLLFPVYGLIWCLILLNEFLPERWARRALAGGRSDRETEQERQLAKARDLVTWIELNHDQGFLPA